MQALCNFNNVGILKFSLSIYSVSLLYTWLSLTMYLIIIDQNECEESNLNMCDVNANCTNNIGSYDCMCYDSFYGDGFSCIGKIIQH